MLEVIADALLDTLKLVPVLLIANVLIEVLEHAAVGRISTEKALKGPLAPLIGAGVGLLPQCGFSVVAAKLYSGRHITLGTLFAVFVATSDEAIPILLTSPEAALRLLPLLGVKLIAALVIGYGTSLVLSGREKKRIVAFKEGESIHVRGCHGHEIDSDEEDREHAHEEEGEEKHGHESDKESAEEKARRRKKLLQRYLWHPLFHTLTVSLYVLAVNLILGIIIFFVTEERLTEFMESARLLQPLFAAIVGLIPNCAASVAIAELYAVGTLGLGGAVAGLSVGAGLGFAVLFKENRNVKENLIALAVLFVFSVGAGMLVELISMLIR